MTTIQNFATLPFIEALKAFFKSLNVPINYLSDLPASPEDVFGEAYNVKNPAHQLINEVYALGMVNDAIFSGNATFEGIDSIKKLDNDYDGLLILGIILTPSLSGRAGEGLPTRSQLAEITRAFNRVFPYTPVTIVFKYDTYISFANSERVKYLQEWREGEKIGKVSLLRDINFTQVHAGHYRILNDLAIARTGKNAINSFSELYKYWQSTLSVSILNKAFYGELQNWYFWAIQEVNFPNPPLRIDFSSDNEFDEALKEHKGKNVIRLLTRILFIWFIKEKGLIPEEIFDEKTIASKILNEFEPQKPQGLFATGKHNSKYYRAILQNLFFATLNQPCKKRAFRTDGQHQNATQLMRYRSYFKDADYFVSLMEAKVPFMNGGLFECLDKPHPTAKGKQGGDRIIYVDGFSDRSNNDLLVPDHLFFDADEEVDLSKDLGDKNKKSKTRGLIAILKSYKFTITENTPIDEDVALDPELLGKVFENLLASYNPETKTTARKQTGSFYTPREIVDYMVDESLIAYLAPLTPNGGAKTPPLGAGGLHQLVSYSNINPFADDEATQRAIIKALDNCKILDPACGSGAYPMGILQKMVHILHKIDPQNTEWKNRQLKRVNNAIAELEQMDDTTFRENTIRELEAQKQDIEESFANNELDYGRKLYLIENCIFGVDIQPIATQIAKLRFFISLVVDQKVDATRDNFGIRPLPNLETKFVAANTLIGIEKPQKKGDFFGSLFDKNEVRKLEDQLKKVRQRLFSAKTPSSKRALREQDKALREQMGDLLVEEYGNATARQLANWDPYDQNTTSPFFDKEWMFDIREGFDIVIGNPPYGAKLSAIEIEYFKKNYSVKTSETAILFIEKGFSLLKKNGIETYIIPKSFTFASNYEDIRNLILDNIFYLIDCGKAFEQVKLEACVFGLQKNKSFEIYKSIKLNDNLNFSLEGEIKKTMIDKFGFLPNGLSLQEIILGERIYQNSLMLKYCTKNSRGEFLQNKISEMGKYPLIGGKEINKYGIRNIKGYIDNNTLITEKSKIKENAILAQNIVAHITQPYEHLKIIACIPDKKDCLIVDTINQITITDDTLKNKYLWCLLNSKLVNWYCYLFILAKAIRTIHFDSSLTSRIPISKLSLESQQPFIALVDKILAGKKTGEDTQAWEDEIDLRVYKLYALTHAEVLLIDPTFGLSAEEYEAFS